MLYDKNYRVKTIPPYTKYNGDIKNPRLILDGMNELECNIKCATDFLIATTTLIVFSPLLPPCYCLVKREDSGPVVFKQERIGRFDRPFTIYRFYSMCIDAEKSGPQLYGHQHDKRMTRIGRYLRAHHLDELPQLWSAVKGNMTLIGPRPEQEFYTDQIIQYDPRYAYLYQIRPGVTFYATLYNGYTGAMGEVLKRLDLDLYYLEHRSWWFNMKILAKTFINIVLGKIF